MNNNSNEIVESPIEHECSDDTPIVYPKYNNPYKEALYNWITLYHCEEYALEIIKQMDEKLMNSGLVRHAKREFEVLGWPGDDEMQELMCDNILELLGTFGHQGHSGSSAYYLINLFNKLSRYEIISPITGEDSEWCDVCADFYQNNRCGHVFKNKETGECYDGEGKIFREPNGCCYTSIGSRVPVVFPYTPKSEYVDVPSHSDRVEIDNAESGTKL